MFCPKCGKSDQVAESYCRQCGFYLPNFSAVVNREVPPEEHLKANTVLSLMTISVSFTLAILLYAFFGFRTNTHPLIYVTAGLLLGMGGWHIQTLIRTLVLKKQWKRRAPLGDIHAGPPAAVKSAATGKLLDQADFTGAIPVSVTEQTTRHLVETPQPKSK